MLVDEQRADLLDLINEYGTAVLFDPANRRKQIKRIVDFVDGLTASAAPAEGRDERANFLAWWCEDVPECMREKWKENADECLRSGNATDKFASAWDAWEERSRRATAPTMSEAARDVLDERKRSAERYGFTTERDDKYDPGILASAGLAYAMWASDYLHPYSLGDGDRDREGRPPIAWPWSRKWWKPKTPRIALVKACNLILAEIERIDRAAAKEGS